jgi:hypothetical protein
MARLNHAYTRLSGPADPESMLHLINNKFPDGEPQAGELIKIIE